MFPDWLLWIGIVAAAVLWLACWTAAAANRRADAAYRAFDERRLNELSNRRWTRHHDAFVGMVEGIHTTTSTVFYPGGRLPVDTWASAMQSKGRRVP